MKRALRERLRHLSLRDALGVGLPAIALIVGAFWLAAQYIKPAPPNYLIMSTGADGGAYQTFAARYKPILARNGIELRERPSAGAIENLARLMNPGEVVDVAFVQGGLGIGNNNDRLESLGSFYYEPLWVFYRGSADIDRLTQLKGKRLAIGGEGSGTRKLALELLHANGIDEKSAQLSPLGGLAAVDALSKGTLDAVFAVGPAQSAAVWSLLYTPGVKVMDFAQADAYTRRFAYLSKVVLPRGAIDLVRDIPPQDVALVAPLATIVTRADTHPALIDLLIQAAAEVHGQPGLFQRAHEFPNSKQVDFPLSAEAERYYKSGTRFLQRYLPFWAATLIERMIVLLIPVFAVLVPLMKVLPFLYTWRVRSRIYKWYGELKFLEASIEEDPHSPRSKEWLEQLDRLEARVNRIPTPLAYANQLYILREHIGLVREAVRRRSGGASPAHAQVEEASRRRAEKEGARPSSDAVAESPPRRSPTA